MLQIKQLMEPCYLLYPRAEWRTAAANSAYRRGGQSIWLDYIRRDLITNGEFQRLVEQDGVMG